MSKYLSCLLIILLTLAIPQGDIAQGTADAVGQAKVAVSSHTEADNLLVNGNMEELPFYWKPPNHFVAGGWRRWWMQGDIPEYDDVRAWRPERYDGNHAQVYFRWGATYTAGIYQRVLDITPCAFHQFSMYGRNHSQEGADHHARIGLDPYGRTCGTSVTSFPSGIVWSPERTYFKIWGLHTVTAESQGDRITAITYASPDPHYGYYDTFWDAGTLIEIPPPGGRLPESETWDSDGFVSNVVTSTVVNYMRVEWDTLEASSTQVWYHAWTPATITSSLRLTETIHLPLIFREQPIVELLPTLTRQTVADYTRVTHHQALLGPFEDGQIVQFVALSRHFDGSACQTENSGLVKVTFHTGPIHSVYFPLMSNGMEE